MRTYTFLPITFFAIGFGLSVLQAADQWPAFQNGGRCRLESEQLPLKWSSEDGVAWSVELSGYGQSTPIIWGGNVYVTFCSGEMKDTMFVQALRLDSGKTLWEHQVKNSTPEKNSGYVSRAAPSPVADAAGVIAFFEGGNVVALGHDGKERWKRDLVQDYGPITARHGLAASLEQNEQHVFVWVERQEKPYVVALDKKSGEPAWKADGVGKTSWSSPRLVPVEKGHHLVLSAIGRIVGLDPTNGKHLWQFDEIAKNSTPTPIPVGEGRFLIGATEGRGESDSGTMGNSNGVIQISKNDAGEYSADFLWRAEKARSSFGSPIRAGDNVYFVNRGGVVHCLEAKTGKKRYADRIEGSVWATPLHVGNRIYFFGRQGTTTVIRDGDSFEILAKNELWKESPEPEQKSKTQESTKTESGKEKPEKDKSEKKKPATGPKRGPVLYAVAASGDRFVFRRGDRVYCVASKAAPQARRF